MTSTQSTTSSKYSYRKINIEYYSGASGLSDGTEREGWGTYLFDAREAEKEIRLNKRPRGAMQECNVLISETREIAASSSPAASMPNHHKYQSGHQ